MTLRARSLPRALALAAVLVVLAFPLLAGRAEALDPDTNAVVRGDGDCLRLRAQPTTAGAILTCIPDGTTVRVLAGTVGPIDGFRWQRIAYGGQEGWSVEQFLRAAGTAAPPPASTAPPAAPVVPAPTGPLTLPSLTGNVPASGIGLAVWGGGPIDRIPAAAGERACGLRAIWLTRDGEFVGYIYGAPGIVNAAWSALYADGTLPSSTPLILVCQGGAALAPAGPPPASTPPPSAPPPGPVATPGVPEGIPRTPPGPAGNG